jgi:glycosyltransferase involved in cell wall biosynthesis
MLDIPSSKKVLLLYGQVNNRKGLDHALECMASLPDECAFLVAGTEDAWAAALMGGEAARRLGGDRIFAVNRYMDAELEAACFAASDAVWMGYRSHYGSSGVLTQAAVTGLPVIACREGLIGYRTNAAGLGKVVDVEDHAACVHALSECLYMGKDGTAALKENAKKLAVIHTPEAFARTILEGLV